MWVSPPRRPRSGQYNKTRSAIRTRKATPVRCEGDSPIFCGWVLFATPRGHRVTRPRREFGRATLVFQARRRLGRSVLGKVVEGDGNALPIWHGRQDTAHPRDQDQPPSDPLIVGCRKEHADDDQTGEKRGGVVHEPPGVAFQRFELQVATATPFAERVPTAEEATLPASGTSFSNSATNKLYE